MKFIGNKMKTLILCSQSFWSGGDDVFITSVCVHIGWVHRMTYRCVTVIVDVDSINFWSGYQYKQSSCIQRSIIRFKRLMELCYTAEVYYTLKASNRALIYDRALVYAAVLT